MKTKTILEFTLPEEQLGHQSVLVGADAILLIKDVLSSVDDKLKYDSGFFKE